MKKKTGAGTEWIRCPFFRSHDTLEIGCEGITSSTKLRLLFELKADRMRHEEIFCCRHYEYCELYGSIRRQYEDDD